LHKEKPNDANVYKFMSKVCSEKVETLSEKIKTQRLNVALEKHKPKKTDKTIFS
jgi:hypothetical protein